MKHNHNVKIIILKKQQTTGKPTTINIVLHSVLVYVRHICWCRINGFMNFTWPEIPQFAQLLYIINELFSVLYESKLI